MTCRHRKNMPLIWLMTDERIGDAALLAAVARLPRGRAGIIFRHYRTDSGVRRALFDAVRAIARRRRLVLMLAGTARQAAAWAADGWHGRDARRAGRPMRHSAPVHDAREMVAAGRGGADMVLLSPLFPTRSHPGGASLGRVRFAALARGAMMPVVALGGMTREHGRMLRGIGAAGWAAIDGLAGE
ncbi:thiamine phosphate synthase [Sphingobium terrigena]|uniref:Thiamine phosphate synthase n=1 Tax=Sphingobium terrigena TaxID=2304063 RepID=A0A418YY24_9SPHN|nr:thiamine phosphate synthase [Sphingobium terrigena]RJG57778.1 thiamine phosphate synthase [Sphingobium terrigena]